jgi:hypothetical protein
MEIIHKSGRNHQNADALSRIYFDTETDKRIF